MNGYITIVTSYDTKGTNHYLLGTAVKFTIELAPYKNLFFRTVLHFVDGRRQGVFE